MNKKILVPAVLFVFVLIFSFFALSNEKSRGHAQTNGSPANQIILFVGDGCPHCAIVEDYIAKNKVGDKISFVQKEVYHNQDNANELGEKAKICGLPTNSIGIPFLWDGNGEKCVIGDQDIVGFFKSKTGQQ